MSQVNPNAIRIAQASPQSVQEFDEMMSRSDKQTASRVRVAQRRARVAALYATNNTISAIIEQITEEFDLEVPPTVAQIRNDVRAQIEFWRAEGLKHIDEKQAIVLASIDNIEELARNAYFASMEGRVTHNFEKQIERAKAQKGQDKERERVFEERIRPIDLLEEQMFWEENPDNDLDGSGPRTARQIRDNDLPNGRVEDFLVTTSEKIKEYKRFEATTAGDPRFLAIMLDCSDRRCKLWNLYVKDREAQNPDSAFAKMSDEDKQNRLGMILSAARNRIAPPPTHLAPEGPLGGRLEEPKQLAEGEQNDD